MKNFHLENTIKIEALQIHMLKKCINRVFQATEFRRMIQFCYKLKSHT